MQAVVGTPVQITQDLQAGLMTKYWGDGNKVGIVKALDNAKLASLTLGGAASIAAAGVLVSFGAVPLVVALTAAAYAGLAGGMASELAKRHQASKYFGQADELRNNPATTAALTVRNAQPTPSGPGASAGGLTADEKLAIEWIRNAYQTPRNTVKLMDKFQMDYEKANGRTPDINWLKVGVEVGSKKLVDSATYYATRGMVRDAISHIQAKGDVDTALTRSIVKEGVKIDQRAKLDRLDPDSWRAGRNASYLSLLKEKVAGMLRENKDVKNGVRAAQSGFAPTTPRP